jgi:hypothetical protein
VPVLAPLLDDADAVELFEPALEVEPVLDALLGSVDVEPVLDPAVGVEEVGDPVSPPLSPLELQLAAMNASERTMGAKRECIETSSRTVRDWNSPGFTAHRRRAARRRRRRCGRAPRSES